MTEPTAQGTDFRLEIEKVSSVIATARRVLREGRAVDLTLLERKVRALTDDIRRTAPANGRDLKEQIAAIVEDLDRLEAELGEQYKRVAAELEGALRHHATGAYQRSRNAP